MGIIKFKENDLKVSTRIPTGTHLVFITKIELKQSKRGDDMYVITFSDKGGRTETGYFSLSPKALFKLVALFRAVGIPDNEIQSEGGIDTVRLLHKKLTLIKEKIGTRVVNDKEYGDYAHTYCAAAQSSEASIVEEHGEDLPF